MRIALDANEYIFALGLFRKESCKTLLTYIIDTFPSNSICICRTIVEEVRTNLTLQEFHNFIRIINLFSVIDEDFLIPFELGAKYEAKNLKPADSLIAAYTEWTNSNILVTENRHFLTNQSNLPFKVLNAESCLKLLNK